MIEIAYFVTPIFFSLLGVFLTFGEGIYVNHPLRNAKVFSNMRSANLKFFFNKSAYLKSQ